MPLFALPNDVMCAHIACLMGLASIMQFRGVCKTFNDMFLNYINVTPAIWMPMVTSVGFIPAALLLENVNGVTLLHTLFLCRPTQVLPSLASQCICVWAVVKNGTDDTILGVATTLKYDGIWWEGGYWTFALDLEWWCTDCSSVVKHVVPEYGQPGDRWVVNASIDLYMWSKKGMTKLGTADIDLPSGGAEGAGNEISDEVRVILFSDMVELCIFDKEPDANGRFYSTSDDFDDDGKQTDAAEICKKYANLIHYQPIYDQIKKIPFGHPKKMDY